MNACSACGSPNFRRERVLEHEDIVLGYPVMLHCGADRISCGDCLHETVLIRDLPGLMATVAASRIMMGEKLSGREMQLIRKAANLKAVDLAKRLDVSAETISRWENDREPMRAESERGFRLQMLDVLSTRAHVSKEDFQNLIGLAINPIRPAKWPITHFERIKVREADKKSVQWEPAEELIAASCRPPFVSRNASSNPSFPPLSQQDHELRR